jgi:hypothetical protein
MNESAASIAAAPPNCHFGTVLATPSSVIENHAMKERFFEFRAAVSLNRVRRRRTGVSKNTDTWIRKLIRTNKD